MGNKITMTILALSVTILNLISYIILDELSPIWMAVWTIGIIALIRILPVCRGYENLWAFVLTFLCSIAGNVKAVYYLWVLEVLSPGIPIIGDIVVILELYLVVLTVEELIVGVITRCIWKRQYKITV